MKKLFLFGLLFLAPLFAFAESGIIFNQSSGTIIGTVHGDGSGLTNISASSVAYPFQTVNSSFSVGVELVNAVPALFWRAPSSKLLLGCNGNNGECGSTNVDSEGIGISGATADKYARIKADRFGLTHAYDTNWYYFRADATELYVANNETATPTKIFNVVRASSQTSVNGSLVVTGTTTLNGPLIQNGRTQTVAYAPVIQSSTSINSIARALGTSKTCLSTMTVTQLGGRPVQVAGQFQIGATSNTPILTLTVERGGVIMSTTTHSRAENANEVSAVLYNSDLSLSGSQTYAVCATASGGSATATTYAWRVRED